MTVPRAGRCGRASGVPAAAPHTRAAGPLQADHLPASGPVAAAHRVRRFWFVIADSPRCEVSAKRREAVAEYLSAWAGAAIVAEQRDRGRCWVWLRLRRPASIASTREFLKECPHYTPRSFKVVTE